jgi:hypothetical protein
MARATASSANDVGGEVFVFRAVILAMTEVATVLTELIFVIAKGAVKRCEFTKLVSLVIVFSLGS